MYVPEEIMRAYRKLTVQWYVPLCHRVLTACLLCVLHNAKQWQPDACVLEPRVLAYLSIPNITFTLCISGCLEEAINNTG